VRSLNIHFLNVGHGDCTIIDFPDRLTVVDINTCRKLAAETEKELRERYRQRYQQAQLYKSLGSILGGKQPQSTIPGTGYGSGGNLYNIFMRAAEEKRELDRQVGEDVERLTDPIDYLKRNFSGRPIFRYIQTHPDMDHMAGLFRLVYMEKIPIWNFWDTAHSIEKDETAKKWQNVNFDINDWHTYQQLRRSTTNPTVLRPTYGVKNQYYTEDGISIWAPFDTEGQDDPDADPNSFSYVLHIQFGQCSIVLGGDLPAEKWAKLKNFPKVNLLKPSHHGRKSGYDRETVKAMAPDVSVVSVGELKAKDDASASYERFSTRGCYSTVDHGDIIATCWENGYVSLNTTEGKRVDAPAPKLNNLAMLAGLMGTPPRH
jgi:hypothetical protein